MFTGTPCPQCGEPVMPYGRFLREAEPHKTSRCSSCDAVLTRRKGVWLLLGAGAIVIALVVGLGIPWTFERWGAFSAATFTILFTGIAVLALNVTGWLFVGWDLAADDTVPPPLTNSTDGGD